MWILYPIFVELCDEGIPSWPLGMTEYCDHSITVQLKHEYSIKTTLRKKKKSEPILKLTSEFYVIFSSSL